MDEEKQMLQDKLTELKDSLQEATKQIETLANQHFAMKSQLDRSMERAESLEEENNVLRIKERDLLAFKKRHEEYLENLCRAVDVRVDVWKVKKFSIWNLNIFFSKIKNFKFLIQIFNIENDV